MTGLTTKRCLRHRQREAVAMCPACGQFFCRECICEHEGRILCSRCLSAAVPPPSRSRRFLGRLGGLFCASFGLLLLWMVFYYCGNILLALPSSFHEGTFWHTP